VWGGEISTFSHVDSGTSLALGNNDNIYVTGYFRDTADFNPGAGLDIHTSFGFEDSYISSFDSNGEFQWANTFGSDLDDRGMEIVLDSLDNIYVAGRFRSTVDFNPYDEIETRFAENNHDCYLYKVLPNGHW